MGEYNFKKNKRQTINNNKQASKRFRKNLAHLMFITKVLTFHGKQ